MLVKTSEFVAMLELQIRQHCNNQGLNRAFHQDSNEIIDYFHLFESSNQQQLMTLNTDQGMDEAQQRKQALNNHRMKNALFQGYISKPIDSALIYLIQFFAKSKKNHNYLNGHQRTRTHQIHNNFD